MPESQVELLYQAVEAALGKASHQAPTRLITRPADLAIHRDAWLPLESEQGLPALVLGPAMEGAERVVGGSFGGGAEDHNTVERRVRFVIQARVAGRHSDLAPHTTWARAAVLLDPGIAALVRDLSELGGEYEGSYVSEPLAAAGIIFEAVLETLEVDDTESTLN